MRASVCNACSISGTYCCRVQGPGVYMHLHQCSTDSSDVQYCSTHWFAVYTALLLAYKALYTASQGSAGRAVYESLFLDCGCVLSLPSMRAMLRTAALLGLICAAYVVLPVESTVLDLDMSQAFANSLLTQAPSSAPSAGCVSVLRPSILHQHIAESCIYNPAYRIQWF